MSKSTISHLAILSMLVAVGDGFNPDSAVAADAMSEEQT
jgi:hypothetical protein